MQNYPNYPVQPPRGMSRPQLAGSAQKVADAGRGDDSTLIHVSPNELRGLAAMAPGGRLPINPKTGLPEAGILSAILGTVGTIAGSFIGAPELGPILGGAVGGGLGTFGGSLLEGNSLGNSLGMGLMGGLASYGMGSAFSGLAGAGAGDAAHAAAEQIAQNGVTPATLADFAPATSQIGSGATDGALFGGFDGSEGALLGGATGGSGAAGTADPFLSGALNSPSLGGVSQFAGAPTIVDPATGAAQNFSPTNSIITQGSNALKGAADPSALYNTFVKNASSTTLPILGGYYGMSMYDQPQQQVTSPYAPIQDNEQMPTLPGPNQRKYTPAPADWDYSTGKAWNYWTPAFADGGPVRSPYWVAEGGVPITRKSAPKQFSGFAARAPDDGTDYDRTNAETVRQINQTYRPDATNGGYARGGLVDTYGGRAFGRPVTMRPMARLGQAPRVAPIQAGPPIQMGKMLKRGMAGGGPVSGPGGGLDDAIPAVINGRQPAALSSGEYVVPAHAVSALGDGSSEAGSAKLDQMVGHVMQTKYGTRHPARLHGGGSMGMRRPFAEGGLVGPDDDMTSRYNTLLSPEEEADYQKEYSPQDSYDYDMRGAFTRGIVPGENGHYPDTFKKPNHPTFSDQSQYHGKDGYYGGSWQKMGDGWQFTPGSANLAIHGTEGLKDYLRKQDPTVTVVPPPVQGLAAYAEGGEVDDDSPFADIPRGDFSTPYSDAANTYSNAPSSNVEDRRSFNPLSELGTVGEYLTNSAKDYFAPDRNQSALTPSTQDLRDMAARERASQARAAMANSLLEPNTIDAKVDRLAARNFERNLEWNDMVREMQRRLQRGYARGGMIA